MNPMEVPEIPSDAIHVNDAVVYSVCRPDGTATTVVFINSEEGEPVVLTLDGPAASHVGLYLQMSGQVVTQHTANNN
jgi:hypothetical protein